MNKTGMTYPMGGRMIGLDYFRIALAVLIFMFHSRMHIGCDYLVLNSFVSMGAIAMTGFMMLSGFVLYRTYCSKDLSDICEIRIFTLKRLITILPSYYAIAILHICWQLIRHDISVSDVLILLPIDLTGTQSTFFSLFDYSHHGGTWFISCILICYLAYPYLQSVLSRISDHTRRWILVLLICFELWAPVVRIWFDLDMVSLYANPFNRLIEFTIGILLSQISAPRLIQGIRSKGAAIMWVLGICLVFVALVTVKRFIGIPADYMVISGIAIPLYSVIMLILSHDCFVDAQPSKTVLYLSELSFTFYLCQVLPLWKLTSFLCGLAGTDANVVKIILSLVLCTVGAVAIHELVEKPSSGFLKRKLLNN